MRKLMDIEALIRFQLSQKVRVEVRRRFVPGICGGAYASGLADDPQI